ncbi:MAG: class I SAM-dependent methyltransferase [Candidatus Doudnabacteria bacterium]|nr:class I SAM-dependent methyltransferase [bacterium]MDZ4243923.1 class I SAM-dependent methyltransferase [Candidatus Doudnabacteria bacterium]
MKWTRTISFKPEKIQQEAWTFEDGNETKKYSVEVTLGKPIDILSLKMSRVEDFKSKVETVKASRTEVYANPVNLEEVKNCPICQNPSDRLRQILNIYGAVYTSCEKCFHCYALSKPTDAYLASFYKTNDSYQSTYADKNTQKQRLEWISKPKAEYVLNEYKKRYGRLPKKVLDIGAGSGHFVYQLRQMGIDCDGVEISESGIAFAKEVFGVELLNIDFLKEADKFECDIVTFWGLIEHVSKPVEMLAAARRALGPDGMVVAEVPRFESLSTAVHRAFPDSVIRHLDPMDHNQCFSDSSLATAFVLSGLDIVSAWYFGMDAYEFISQLAYRAQEDKVIKVAGEKIPVFQEQIDLGRLSDFVLFIGIPSKKQ